MFFFKFFKKFLKFFVFKKLNQKKILIDLKFETKISIL
jgi:hypothetical protein